MIEKVKNIMQKRYFHIILISCIIILLMFALGIIILKYNVEGETNMPFELNKIAIISSTEGNDVETTDTRWAFDIYQSNDIYLYINKNENYKEEKAIEEITIDNIKIESNKKDNIKIYKPDENVEGPLFKNVENNIVENLTYEGSMETILKQLRISNQGGIIVFRCSNDNLARYTSNDEIINHYELLKKAEIQPQDLQMKLTFDLSIKIKEGNKYKAEIELQLPIENVIEEGRTSTEITQTDNFIFKRTNN